MNNKTQVTKAYEAMNRAGNRARLAQQNGASPGQVRRLWAIARSARKAWHTSCDDEAARVRHNVAALTC